MIETKWRNTLQDVRGMRGADVASDHQLVTAKIIISLKNNNFIPSATKIHIVNFQTNHGTQEKFKIKLEQNLGEIYVLKNICIESCWQKYKNAVKKRPRKLLSTKVDT